MYTLPDPMRLRNAVSGDAEFCRLLYASTRDDLRQLPLEQAMIDALIAMQQQAVETGQRTNFPDAQTLILEYGDVPAGRMVLDTGGQPWRLVDLALMPAMRKRGLASALLAALQQRARSEGAGIGLAVMRTNAQALHLYQRHGFTIVSGNDIAHDMVWLPA